MLSRVADSVYWMNRQIERAENVLQACLQQYAPATATLYVDPHARRSHSGHGTQSGNPIDRPPCKAFYRQN